jgi:hypothetical protein
MLTEDGAYNAHLDVALWRVISTRESTLDSPACFSEAEVHERFREAMTWTRTAELIVQRVEQRMCQTATLQHCAMYIMAAVYILSSQYIY